MKTPIMSKETHKAGRELNDNIDLLVSETVKYFEEHPERYIHLGENRQQILHDGMRYVISMLANILMFDAGEMLQQQLDWAAIRSPHDGISISLMVTHLEEFCIVADKYLTPASATEIEVVVNWMTAYLKTKQISEA